jgi:hypothetical protein
MPAEKANPCPAGGDRRVHHNGIAGFGKTTIVHVEPDLSG